MKRYFCIYGIMIIKVMAKGTLIQTFCVKDEDIFKIGKEEINGKVCSGCKEKSLIK